MAVSLLITWAFWLIVIVIDVIIHPREWYLFFVPPIIISVIIVGLAAINNLLCIILTIAIHLFIVIELLVSYFKK